MLSACLIEIIEPLMIYTSCPEKKKKVKKKNINNWKL